MRLTVPSAGGSSAITTQDEGSTLSTTVTTLNFTGAGVSASGAGATTTINIPGGAGTGASGTATLDFGSTPGTNYVTVAVTGQTTIASNSHIRAWIQGTDSTATHNAFEHTLLPLYVNINTSDVIAGTGFTINAITELRLSGTISVRWQWT
jgi:hypothetical protein